MDTKGYFIFEAGNYKSNAKISNFNFYLRSVLNKYIKYRIHSIKQNTCRHDQRRVYINLKFDIIIIDSKEDYCLER